ncbi:MAG: hypothetical protein COX78_01310 [Candidatus Levybacteria bacterium CG_4_10_14_0_2_um_filter_35_8]|nr:MAG: hypothetical protein COX78_01310 [Candidatus Levybacteria bacterium CG_4_10_14_0_2_um_filter_35_8]
MNDTEQEVIPTVKLSEYRKVRPIVKKVEEKIGGDAKTRRLTRRAAAFASLQMQRKVEELEEHALEDSLTGLKNRRWFMQEMETKMASSRRTNKPLFLIYIDYDDFKKYNTAFGHSGGDVILQQIAKLPFREDESIARLGGDEFGQLINREATEEDLRVMIIRYQEQIREEGNRVLTTLPHVTENLDPKEVPNSITLTFGVAKFDPSDSPKSFLKRANEAAHYVKRSGKNFVALGINTPEGSIKFRNLVNNG